MKNRKNGPSNEKKSWQETGSKKSADKENVSSKTSVGRDKNSQQRNTEQDEEYDSTGK